MSVVNPDLYTDFLQLAQRCQYGPALEAKLLEWSAGLKGTLWKVLEAQIRSSSARHNTTSEKFLEELFDCADADAFMALLQE